MKKYVAPRILIKEIKLFEKIASDCWSGKQFYFDPNENKQGDEKLIENITIITTDSGCSVNKCDLADSVYKFFKNDRKFLKWSLNSGITYQCVVNNTGVKNIDIFSSGH